MAAVSRPTRRAFLGAAASAPWVAAAVTARPPGLIVDTHVHLFSGDPQKFPYAANAPYQPKSAPLEQYLKFVAEAGIDHVVIVHPEPYQDDHRYLEYCFVNEQPKGLFKGTCLFDPISPETPSRMEALVKRNPGRIVAFRIHQMSEPGSAPSRSGPITGRDMRSAAMDRTWTKAAQLGLAIQMHFLPYYAPQIEEQARKHSGIAIVLDHLGRAGMGSPAEFDRVLALAKLPNVYMKVSALNYSSKEKPPFRDARPLVRRAYDSFGPDRLIWGGLGHTVPEFETATEIFNTMFDGIADSEKAKIRGLNAKKLFGFV